MTPDRTAINAITARLRESAKVRLPADPEAMAVLAVTTLQGLGWTPPRRRQDTNATEAWDAYEQAMSREGT